MIEHDFSSENPNAAGRTASAPRGASETSLTRVSEGRCVEVVDSLAIEEPMEIRLIYCVEGERQRKTIAITMRTPGNDVELALGFLFNEGILSHRKDFRVGSHFGPASGEGVRNLVHIELHERVEVELGSLERNFYTTSSCGVCGKASVEAIAAGAATPVLQGMPRVESSLIHRLPTQLREAQAVFESTGGLHAAALFSASGELRCLREDVGRHNAVDKVVGALAADGALPAAGRILFTSGRVAFEIVAKALIARFPVVVAVSAPTSLAVSAADAGGLTLVGFARDGAFTVYTHPDRIGAGSGG